MFVNCGGIEILHTLELGLIVDLLLIVVARRKVRRRWALPDSHIYRATNVMVCGIWMYPFID
jgi:hypothetical protein